MKNWHHSKRCLRKPLTEGPWMINIKPEDVCDMTLCFLTIIWKGTMVTTLAPKWNSFRTERAFTENKKLHVFVKCFFVSHLGYEILFTQWKVIDIRKCWEKKHHIFFSSEDIWILPLVFLFSARVAPKPIQHISSDVCLLSSVFFCCATKLPREQPLEASR